MKKIVMVKNGLDINGNRKYLYDFVDSENLDNQYEINKKFNYFGRLTKKGISNQYNIKEMSEWLNSFDVWLNMTVGIELDKAQKSINKCNQKNGCDKYCSVQNINTCQLVKLHNKLINELSYIQEFLKLDIVEVE